MAWLILVFAGLFEVGFTTCMKLSENFSNWKWTVGFFVCIAFSFYLLNKATQTIPLGMSYAVWSGIGAVGTVIVGIIFFKEDTNFWKIFFMSTLVLSILGLKILGTKA